MSCRQNDLNLFKSAFLDEIQFFGRVSLMQLLVAYRVSPQYFIWFPLKQFWVVTITHLYSWVERDNYMGHTFVGLRSKIVTKVRGPFLKTPD